MVLGDHLLNGHGGMTNITFRIGGELNNRVVMRGQKVGTGQECCLTCFCDMQSFNASGLTPRLDVTITVPAPPPCPPGLPPSNCGCPQGTYNVQVDMEPNAYGGRSGCVDFDMGGVTASVLAYFDCDGCDYLVSLIVYTFDCVGPDFPPFNCLLSGFIGTSYDPKDFLRLEARTDGGSCVPYAKAHSYVCQSTGVQIDYTVNFV